MYIEKYLYENANILLNDIGDSYITEYDSDPALCGINDDINFDEAFYELIYESDYNMNIAYKKIGLSELNNVTIFNFYEDSIIYIDDFKDKTDDKSSPSDNKNKEKQIKSFSENIKSIIEGFKKFIANIGRKIQELYLKFLANIKQIDYGLKRMYIDNKKMLSDDNIKRAYYYVFTNNKNNIISNKRIIDEEKYTYSDYMKIDNNISDGAASAFIAKKLSELNDLNKLDNDDNEHNVELIQNMINDFDKDEYYNSITKEIDSIDLNDLKFIVEKLDMKQLSRGFEMFKLGSSTIKYDTIINKIKSEINKDDVYDKTKLNDRLHKIFNNCACIIKECNGIIRLTSFKFITTMQAIKDSKYIAFKIINNCGRKEE